MAIRTEISAYVQSRDNRDLPETQAKLTRIQWEKPDQMKNALQTFGLWFAFTFAAIFVPIIHWVAVPGLFITSFILAIDKFNEKYRNAGGSGECPKCHQPFTLQPSKWSDHFTDNCDSCHADLEIKAND